MFHHLCASKEGVGGQILWDIGPQAKNPLGHQPSGHHSHIVRFLQTRFGTQLQAEWFKEEFCARRRAPGESLQQLYQDICRLVTLTYPSAEALLVTHVGKEAFIAVLSDGKLQLDVMKQEPQNVEAALSHAIKLEAFEQFLASQGELVDHNDTAPCAGHVLSVQLQVCHRWVTATLHKLIGDIQDALAQATKVMAAMVNGLWSGHTAPSKAASSVGSILDAVLTLLALAAGHTVFSQIGRGSCHGCMDHQRARETDLCHVCGQVRQQTDESNWQMESAGRTVTCRRITWTIPADCHQCKRPRRWNQ